MSFRRYGGINRAANNNIIRNNVTTTDNLIITNQVGEHNSRIVVESEFKINNNVEIRANLFLTGATGATGGNGNVNNTNNNIYCNNVYALNAVYANNVLLTSDYRIKENVKSLDNKFQVDYLNPVTFMNKQTKKQDIGLIAHELQEIYPELVSGEKDGDETQTVNYNGLIPILINEIKHLKNEMKILKEKLETKGIL
jgi:hypothetical protein